MRVFRTLLEQKIRERRQTFEEFVEAAEIFAREHGEPGTIGVRHLQRLAAGRGPGGRPLGPVRPATARLLERIFGVSVDELLAPPGRSSPGVQREETQAGVEWLEQLAESLPDSTRRKVAARLDELDLGRVRDRGARLRDAKRSQLARALADYYADVVPYRLYGTSVDGHAVRTSVLTRPEWSEMAVPLQAAAVSAAKRCLHRWRGLFERCVQELLHLGLRAKRRLLVPAGDRAGADAQSFGERLVAQA